MGLERLSRREKKLKGWEEMKRNKKSCSVDSLKVVSTQDVTLLKRCPLQVTLFSHVSTFSPKSTAGHNKATFASWILAWLVTTGICYLALLFLTKKNCTGSLSCSSTVHKNTHTQISALTHLPTTEDVCAGEWCGVCVCVRGGGHAAVMIN